MARITLSAHWKFHRLARAVGSTVLARGILEVLWEPCWLAGDPYCGTSADIEALCEWKGTPGALTRALLMPDAKRAGFIEPFDGRVRDASTPHFQLHDFFDHCPQVARRPRRRQVNVCVVCHGEFVTTVPTATMCGPRCRQAAHRHSTLTRQEALQ